MKIINAKVYTIEEITQEDLNNLALERNTLVQENEELKSQLRGTTHCFDEEEHNRLKEEITNLSKDVDMWNSKYNDMFDENKRLKEALETKSYCKYANKCDELDDCSREEYEDMANANTRLKVENYDLEEENEKLKKQLEDKTEDYRRMKDNFDSKVDVLTEIDTQQKEFIDWLECEVNDYKCKNPLIVENFCTQYDIREIETDLLVKILNKYKEIIGVSDENNKQ